MNRWVTNLGSAVYIDFAVQDSVAYMNRYQAKGIMIDNMVGQGIGTENWYEYRDGKNPLTYSPEVGKFLRAMKQELGTNVLQTNSGFAAAQEVINEIDGVQWEGLFTYAHWRSLDNSLLYFTQYVDKIRALKALTKYVVVTDGPISPWDGMSERISAEREALCDLAKYYLIADENTYFNYQNMRDYSYPWKDWFNAIEREVGKPSGDVYVLQHRFIGQEDFQPAQNLLKNSSFEISTDPAKLPDSWGSYYWGPYPIKVSTVTGVAKDGSAALRLTGEKVQTGGVLQWITLEPNTEYTVTAWVKVENMSTQDPCNLSIVVNAGGGASSTSACLTSLVTGESWLPLSKIFTTGVDTSKAFIYPIMVNKDFSGSVLLDDVRLFKGNKPINFMQVFARQYDKALVLYRPLMTAYGESGDETAVQIALPFKHQPLEYDGALSPALETVSLRAYEGAILLKPSLPAPPSGLKTNRVQ